MIKTVNAYSRTELRMVIDLGEQRGWKYTGHNRDGGTSRYRVQFYVPDKEEEHEES